MEKQVHILQELQDISPMLAGIPSQTPFRVPQGYFAGLPESIMEKIRIETILAGAGSAIFEVPEGYFEGLPAAIFSKIHTSNTAQNEIASELASIAPLLNTLSKDPVFTVPQGYFETADFVGAMQEKKGTGTLISLRITRRWMQYAAAAIVAGVLVTGAFLYTDKGSYHDQLKKDGLSVPVPANGQSGDETAKLNADSSSQGLLNDAIADDEAPQTNKANQPEKIHDLKSGIQSLTEEEMKKYLEENAFPELVVPIVPDTEDTI